MLVVSIVDHFYCNVVRNLNLSYSILLISIVDLFYLIVMLFRDISTTRLLYNLNGNKVSILGDQGQSIWVKQDKNMAKISATKVSFVTLIFASFYPYCTVTALSL